MGWAEMWLAYWLWSVGLAPLPYAPPPAPAPIVESAWVDGAGNPL